MGRNRQAGLGSMLGKLPTRKSEFDEVFRLNATSCDGSRHLSRSTRVVLYIAFPCALRLSSFEALLHQPHQFFHRRLVFGGDAFTGVHDLGNSLAVKFSSL